MRTLLVLGLLLSSLAASGCAEPDAKEAAVKSLEGRRPLPEGTAAIEGYVVDDALDPIAGARVRIASLDLEFTTDVQGYYVTSPLAPGTYRVAAAQRGYEPLTVTAKAVAAEFALAVFVLRPVPLPDTYEAVQIQRGFLACAIALAPPATFETVQASAAVELECGAPRLGGQQDGTDRPAPPFEAQDRSQRRWVLDEAQATWESGGLLTRWIAGHELVREFATIFAVDGCTDDARIFGRPTGASPIQQPVPKEQVAAVLESAEGTTCAMPGERCDVEFCVLSSRVRPAPREIGQPLVRLGAAVQQAFEQELVATFRVVKEPEGQTLK